MFNVQKENPSKEDWCHIVKQDMTLINLFMTEKEIADYSKRELKAIVKKHVTSAAIESLTLKQSGHIKIKHIKYQNNKVKPYLRSNLFSSEESATLFNLWSNTVNGYKMCFPSVYKNDKSCKLGCLEDDSIDHLYTCVIIDRTCGKTKTRFSGVYASLPEQKEAASIFIKRHNTRSSIIEAVTASQGPRQILDTSTQADAGGAGASAGG